jgi:hypothetical protein
MIYCVQEFLYPSSEKSVEELVYNDENGFEWRISRILNGFIIRYFGDPYFRENIFECENSKGECIKVKNTNCIFVQDDDFETFAEFREVILRGCTDEIWGFIRDLLQERFEYDTGLLDSEIVK